MSCKRSCKDQDPDYEDDLTKDQKRLRLIENDNVVATVKKIEKIIETQFAQEMKLKETEIETIDERIYEARQMLDQLRTGIIISYYSFENSNETTVLLKSSETKLPIHPAVKKVLGKLPASKSGQHGKLSTGSSTVFQQKNNEISSQSENVKRESKTECEEGSRAGRFKVKKRLVIGNISKYIPLDQREEWDQSTHKWMIYVRGPKENPSIDSFVSKVWFFLHSSYRPNDVVEVNKPPFHLTRRGWGEFPVRVLLYFRDSRNKPADITHMLRLDKTYTGLQTLGGEQEVDVLIYKDDCVNSVVKDCQVQALYSIPNDIGGISIPACVEQLESVESEESKNLNCNSQHDEMLPSLNCVYAAENAQKHDDNLYSLPDTAVNFNLSNDNSISSSSGKELTSNEINREQMDEEFKDLCLEAVSGRQGDHGSYSLQENTKKSLDSIQTSDCDEMKFFKTNKLNEDSHQNKIIKHDNDEMKFFETNVKLNEDSHQNKISKRDNVLMDYEMNGTCSVSSFINDHGTYVNQNIKSENDSASNHSQPDLIRHKQLVIKQEPVDEDDDDDDDSVKISSAAGDKKVTQIYSSMNLLNSIAQIKSSSILRKDVDGAKVNINSMTTKATLMLNSNNRSSPTAISILNSKHKSAGQALVALPKTNSSLPIVVVSQKSSLSVAAVNDSKSQLRAKVVASSQCTDSSSVSNQTEQKPHGPNGVASFVKCIDRHGTVYLIPFPMYVKMSPSAQANLVRDVAQIQNTTNLTESGIPIVNSVKTEVDPHLNAGSTKHSKISHTNEPSNSSAKTVLSSDISIPSVSTICKLKSNSAKQSFVHNAINMNNAKSSGTSESEISINIDDFDDFNYIVRHIGKKYPLLRKHLDRFHYSYCANTLDEFLNWHVGKRHSSEWLRAKDVRDKILQLVKSSTRWKPVDVWTTKQLYIWFRNHGYTPMKTDICEENAENSILNCDFNTLIDASNILQNLSLEEMRINESETDSSKDIDEEYVDVITVSEKPKTIKEDASPVKLFHPSNVRLSRSKEIIIVQEACRQIGVYLPPEEVCTDVTAYLAETALFSAMKMFLEDITTLAVAERFKKANDNTKCPSCINVEDIASAICSLPSADFLTNSGFGTKVTAKNLLNMNDIKL